MIANNNLMIAIFQLHWLMKKLYFRDSLALSEFISLHFFLPSLVSCIISLRLLRPLAGWCNNIDISNFIAVNTFRCQHFSSSKSSYINSQRLL